MFNASIGYDLIAPKLSPVFRYPAYERLWGDVRWLLRHETPRTLLDFFAWWTCYRPGWGAPQVEAIGHDVAFHVVAGAARLQQCDSLSFQVLEYTAERALLTASLVDTKAQVASAVLDAYGELWISSPISVDYDCCAGRFPAQSGPVRISDGVAVNRQAAGEYRHVAAMCERLAS